MFKKLITALTLACTALPVAAQDRFEMPVSGKILNGWLQSDGSRMAALKLELEPGWKTYWRTPGDAGIPPQFDWSGSENLHGVGIAWPAPRVFLTAGMRTIGYTDTFVLPMTLVPKTAGQPIELNAVIDMGICSDICIPHRMEISAVIDDANTKPTPAIAAALATRPFSAREAGVRDTSCSLSPTEDGLKIETRVSMPSAGGEEVVIVEPGIPGIWMSETDASRQGQTLVAVGEMMTSDGAPVSIDRSKVVITVLGDSHAVEIRGC